MTAPEDAPAAEVASVTVTFHPDPALLSRQLAALRGQVGDIIVVDNGSAMPAAAMADGAARVIAMPENRGVASALNRGLQEARRRGARFALLLDHDSIPTAGMVSALVDGYRRAALLPGGAVAAVGPRVTDVRDRREYPFIRLGWLRNLHLRCGDAVDGLVECDFLISSGTLVALEHLDEIGEFDESLFIDSVDLEWSCRARDRGFRLLGVCGARLDHCLGDQRRQVLPRVALVVHSPQRLYYMTRNRLLLYRRPYVPLKWKLKDVLRMAAKFAVTMLLLAPRRRYAHMTWLALCDGIAGRGGRL